MANGRVPDSVRHRFREMLESPSGYAKFKRIMAATKKEDIYLRYFMEAMDRVFGKSEQFGSIELSGISPVSNEVLERIAGNSTNGSEMASGE
jgi:hypothetical protein